MKVSYKFTWFIVTSLLAMSSMVIGKANVSETKDERVFIFKNSTRIKEKIKVGLILPAKDQMYDKWEVYSGISDQPLEKGELKTSSEVVFFDIAYKTPGEHQLVLIAKDKTGTPKLLGKTSISVKNSFFIERLNKTFEFLMGIALAVLIFLSQSFIKNINSAKSQKKRLKSELAGLLNTTIVEIRRDPNQQLSPLPDWFLGNNMTDWSWELHTPAFTGLRLQIDAVHKRCQKFRGNVNELNSCITEMESILGTL